MLTPGARLGPYEIVASVGAGGMGEVYRARDTRLNRVVALKVLAENSAVDSAAVMRFRREAETVAALNHPNICVLYDIGRESTTDFLVMEHLDGESLAERLERGPLKLDDALRIGIDVARALGAAHRTGIVHRDLKPGNIMLTPTGAKLVDFGLAQLKPHAGAAVVSAMTQTLPATAPGTIIGTLPYMAPEQIEGHPADARTDVFALGAVLYEMVTGKRAFSAVPETTLDTTDKEVGHRWPQFIDYGSSVSRSIFQIRFPCSPVPAIFHCLRARTIDSHTGRAIERGRAWSGSTEAGATSVRRCHGHS